MGLCDEFFFNFFQWLTLRMLGIALPLLIVP